MQATIVTGTRRQMSAGKIEAVTATVDTHFTAATLETVKKLLLDSEEVKSNLVTDPVSVIAAEVADRIDPALEYIKCLDRMLVDLNHRMERMAKIPRRLRTVRRVLWAELERVDPEVWLDPWILDQF